MACSDGGLRSVLVKNDSNAKTTKIQTAIVGMNSDGSAMAGVTKVDYVPTHSSEVRWDRNFNPHTSRWADLTIKINTEELKNRLLQKDKIVTQPSSWAPEIDRAIKRKIKATGNIQLLGVLTRDKIRLSMMYGMNLLFAITSPLSNGDPRIMAFGFLGRNLTSGIVFSIIDTAIYKFEARGLGNRLSLGIGFEPDRALIFNLSFLGKPLVASLDEDRKPLRLK